MLNLIKGIVNIVDRLSEVFFGERRKRARIQLEKLKKQKKEILSQKPTTRSAKRLQNINKKIDELNVYLRSK